MIKGDERAMFVPWKVDECDEETRGGGLVESFLAITSMCCGKTSPTDDIQRVATKLWCVSRGIGQFEACLGGASGGWKRGVSCDEICFRRCLGFGDGSALKHASKSSIEDVSFSAEAWQKIS
jgi:hypothetical protein